MELIEPTNNDIRRCKDSEYIFNNGRLNENFYDSTPLNHLI